MFYVNVWIATRNREREQNTSVYVMGERERKIGQRKIEWECVKCVYK